ncbi:MAG: class I SAM-dependent methyltransferase [Actinobacteria bacterium]|nr:class I SAM-dependent methyltransferase [Actinomycetota bacterium]
MEAPDYLDQNRAAWGRNAAGYEAAGRSQWRSSEPSWGIWSIPESQVGLLPEVSERDTLELGCGTGYVSAWLARRGARPVGLDPMKRDYFGMKRFEWPDDTWVEFHLGYGEWIRLLRSNGFEITDLIELRPEPDRETTYDFVTLEWARSWPSEETWKATKATPAPAGR